MNLMKDGKRRMHQYEKFQSEGLYYVTLLLRALINWASSSRTKRMGRRWPVGCRFELLQATGTVRRFAASGGGVRGGLNLLGPGSKTNLLNLTKRRTNVRPFSFPDYDEAMVVLLVPCVYIYMQGISQGINKCMLIDRLDRKINCILYNRAWMMVEAERWREMIYNRFGYVNKCT